MAKRSKMIHIAEKIDSGITALYIRVSTDKQREEGYSVEIQTERLKAYAIAKFKGKQTKLYVDDGYTGATLDRPAMQELLKDIRDKKIENICVVKLDRLSRSQKDTIYLIEDVFLPNGTNFISINESFDTSTPYGRAMVGILAVFAQLERENIFERTRGGMQKRVESGLWMGGGRVPFGYDYDKSKGILIPNKDANTVQRIYDLYIKGYSLQKIADLCGLKYEKLAHQIITRKTNTGFIVYNGQEYKGQHEAIISIETFNKAMRLMEERSTKYFTSSSGYLLTGLVYCGKCGAKMRYQKWGKDKVKLVCYSQQTSKPYLVKDPDCDNLKTYSDQIEEIILKDLFAMCKYKVKHKPVDIKQTTPLEMFYSQYETLQFKLKRLYGLYSEAHDDILLETINDIKTQIDKLNKKINNEQDKEALLLQVEETFKHIEEIEDLWKHNTIQEKRNILRSLIQSITITGNEVKIEYKI